MKRFVDLPHLPKQCSTILYGEKYAEKLKKPLKNRNIQSIFVLDNPNVDPRLAGHADLSVLHTGGEKVMLAPYLKGSRVADRLWELGAEILFPDIQQHASYPEDVQLNLCLLGGYVLYNAKAVPRTAVEYLTNYGSFYFINCRQGYTRCSCCVVDAYSLITADRGIAAQAASAGLSVLLISPGHILLDGFLYGFIGGASFKLSDHEMAFTGRLDTHPDRDRILQFLSQRDVEAVFLTEEPIFDIGSAVPILEEE